jgi:undecaprenyl diphosphate synthase
MTRRALPAHIGFIPDGNRRWAQRHGLAKEEGYASGVAPGITLFELCRRRGIQEMTVFGFTQDNTKRPSAQIDKFRAACVQFATEVARRGAALLVVGQVASAFFPAGLRDFQTRQGTGMKVNLLVNYHWEWDLAGLEQGRVRSWQVPRLDLIVRWGGGRRLSGFLPVQSTYADFFVVDEYWPDFRPEHFDDALSWFRQQDRTLGG